MKYFTGKDIRGKVQESQATTFRDLVDRHINVAVPLNCTREQYAAMGKEDKNRAKSVAYLVPAVFKESPCQRTTANALHCNLICLDVDPDKETGKSPATPWINNPDTLGEHLSPFAHACYHTASSTPDNPRVRIIVSADNIAVADYARAVTTIAKRIGLVKITDRSTLTPIQPMYLPSLFAGEEDHPMFLYDLTGREFTTKDLDNHEEKDSSQRPARASSSSDLIEFLQRPVEGVDLKTVSAALEHIDADCDYREWLDIAASLRHQFPESDDEAYTLFDLWSSKGTKYAGADETRAKWDSFHHSPLGRLPKTIRTVLQRAALGGWDARIVKEQGFQRLMKWISKDCGSVSSLLAESLKRILSTPLLTQSEQDALIHQVVRQAKTRFNVVVSATALRKDLQTLQHKADAENKDKKTIQPPWAKGVVYVMGHDEFFRHRTHEKIKPPAFDRAYARKLMSDDDEKATIKPSDYALNTIKVPVVFGYDYNPAAADEIFATENGRVYVNTYSRTYPVPDFDGAKEAGDLFTAHLRALISEPEYQRIVLDWCAYIVQHPGKKIRWAILLQGVDGCGKGFISEAMRTALGQEHVKILPPQAIFSGFTEWAIGAQLVALNEVRVAGQNRHEVMNMLKPLISDTHISISQKFADVRQVNNVTNYMAMTNHHDSLVLAPGDRRWFVVKSAMQTREQVMALPADYFNKLHAMLRDNAGGLRAFFEQHQISEDFNPDGHAPATIYLDQLVNDSANETTAAVRKLIQEHEHPLIQWDMLSAKVLMEFLINQEGLTRITPQHLGSVLRDEGFIHSGRHLIGEERHYLWINNRAWHIDNPCSLAIERVVRGGAEHYNDIFL